VSTADPVSFEILVEGFHTGLGVFWSLRLALSVGFASELLSTFTGVRIESASLLGVTLLSVSVSSLLVHD